MTRCRAGFGGPAKGSCLGRPGNHLAGPWADGQETAIRKAGHDAGGYGANVFHSGRSLLRRRVQIRAEVVTCNAGHTLNLKHTLSRNALPLGNGLR